jgi:hypothetical protein
MGAAPCHSISVRQGRLSCPGPTPMSSYSRPHRGKLTQTNARKKPKGSCRSSARRGAGEAREFRPANGRWTGGEVRWRYWVVIGPRDGFAVRTIRGRAALLTVPGAACILSASEAPQRKAAVHKGGLWV